MNSPSLRPFIFLKPFPALNPLCWSFGRVGAILACCVFIIPLCNLPPARVGYFRQIEASLIAFWLMAALIGIWLYFLWKKNPKLVRHIANLPIVWGPLLLGFVTFFFSLSHNRGLEDFVGSAQIGEGGLTFIASGLIAAQFSIFSHIRPYRKVICFAAALTGLLICTLTIMGSQESPLPGWQYWQWAPFFFPDFLAFIAIALLAVYFCCRPCGKNIKNSCTVIALLLFGIVVFYASNKSLYGGILIAGFVGAGVYLLPLPMRRPFIHSSFFGLSIGATLLIAFFDSFSALLPDTFKAYGNIQTLTSRTWLSKVTFIDLWYSPFTWESIEKLLTGNGWGSFGNISAANMFLIRDINLYAGNDYQPGWELINRDLLHTHNIVTTLFHSIGLIGIYFYLYIQYKLINSLPERFFIIGSLFLMAYQVQMLLWFQFLMTVPFTLLAFSLLFSRPSKKREPCFLKPGFLTGYSAVLLIFSVLQGYVTLGYKYGLLERPVKSNTELVNELTTAHYAGFEVLFGAPRLIGLARTYSIGLQHEFEKSPEQLLNYSLKLVHYLMFLPKKCNYLANNLALNILSELSTNPKVAPLFTVQIYKTWEQLAKDHIEIMPYRTDILLPFFNFYQTLGKEAIVLELTREIMARNPRDPIALWFKGSSQLQNPSRFDEGMCALQSSIRQGIERFMPVPPVLKSKILHHARLCPPEY